MRKSLLCFTSGIEFNQVKGNFLDLRLCFFFQAVPNITTQLIHLGYCPLLARVLGNFMEATDIHVENIRILIH